MTLSETTNSKRPFGVRAATGARAGQLTWVTVSASGVAGLEHAGRVVVQDGDTQWLGEIVVLPGQLVESVVSADLPEIVRAVREDDSWPVTPDRAGRELLDALGLPPALLEPATS